MRTVLTIAKNTFRQVIRDKILYGIVIFAFIFIGSTAVLSSLAIEDSIFIIKTLGLAGIYIFGLIITVFLGGYLVYDEVEKRTTYILLAKPVTRTNIIIGKFLGLLAGIALLTFLMTAAYLVVVYANGGGMDYYAFINVWLELCETALLIAFLILFSVFTTPLASTIYTILIIYIGHLLGLIQAYAMKSAGLTKDLLLGIYYVLPNLEKFDIRSLIAHNLHISRSEMFFSSAYALVYIVFLLYIAGTVFNKKDL